MEGTPSEVRNNVVLHLPVKISYKVLESYLQKKFLGKVLSKGKKGGGSSDHARIQKINLQRSPLDDFDLAVHLQLKLLTTLFKNKIITMVVHLSVGFKEAQQEIHISRYKLEGENNGWFTNKIVETLINNFMYSSLQEKMKYDLRPLVNERLEKLNNKFAGGLEVIDGMNITGTISEFSVQEVIPGQYNLLVAVKILGNNVLNIKRIDL